MNVKYKKQYTFRRIGITDHLRTRVENEGTDVFIVLNQIAYPERGNGTKKYYNQEDSPPQLAHYKENARAVPEFFALRDAIVEKKGVDPKDVPIKIVNNKSQQALPYVHSKYMIIEGTPNSKMEYKLRGGSEYVWAGSSNTDNYGAWDNAEITVIMDDETEQGKMVIGHYKENFNDLMAKGRTFHEDTRIFGGKDKHGKWQDINYDYYKENGSRDINNTKQY